MGYRHTEEDILKAATKVAFRVGFSALTFAKVADELRISDRTVVYYFPSKPDLVVAVAQELTKGLVALLEKAFGQEPRTPAEIISQAWSLLTTPTADKIFSVYFEIVGLASARQEPYVELARTMVDGSVQWLIPRMVGSTATVRKQQALATVAQIDGLLLLRRVLGKAAAEAAVRELIIGANDKKS